MIPEEVFHYTKMSTALEKILFDKKIKLGQLGFTNDPRESKERVFATFQSFRISDKKYAKILKDANRIIKKEWKVFCVSQHCPDHALHIADLTYPFLLGDCRPRMWATYADNHKGVCLRFNGIKFNERLEKELGNRCKIFSGSVDYNNFESTIPSTIGLHDDETLDQEDTIRDYFTRSWQELFLMKSKDWETEFEYRWLVHSLKDSAEYVSIVGVIEGVLVGQDFPKAYWPSLMNLCKELNVPAGHIEWSNGMPYCNYQSIYKP